jgi:hypothetical protein
MLFTGSLLGLLYVVFGVALFYFLNVGLAPLLVIVVGLAVFQYYTSDKLALAAAGAKVVSREEAPALHDMVERLCALADLPEGRDRRHPSRTHSPPAGIPSMRRHPVTTGLWRRLEAKEVSVSPMSCRTGEPGRARDDGGELLAMLAACHPLRPLRRDVQRLWLAAATGNNGATRFRSADRLPSSRSSSRPQLLHIRTISRATRCGRPRLRARPDTPGTS